MPDYLALIHTVPPLIGVFDRLVPQILPGVPVKHILDEPLLEAVRQRGGLADEDAERLCAHVQMAQAVGARAVLVTCSTISPLVDSLRGRVSVRVMKIDEAMISKAVQAGEKIAVLATNPTTLGPTRLLLTEQAARAGRRIEISETLIDGALGALLAGDGQTHDRLVRQAVIERASGVDALVLAQASMARVLEVLPETERPVPVFSSPHLALESLRDSFG